MRIKLVNNSAYIKQLGIVIIIAKIIYSTILFCVEMPFLSPLFINKDIFNYASVECSHLPIMLSLLTSCILAINISNSVPKRYHLIKILQYLALIGIICIIFPQIYSTQVILNNYIPIINNLIFILGLSCFGVAIILLHLVTINIYNLTSITLTLIIFIVFISFTCSYYSLQTIIIKYPIDLPFFYEAIFWSGSNIMNVFFTQTLMVAWIYLTQSLLHIKFNGKIVFIYTVLILLNTVVAISGLLGHLIHDMESPYFRQFYINYTQYFVSIAPIFFALTALHQLLTIKFYKSNYYHNFNKTNFSLENINLTPNTNTEKDFQIFPNRYWQQITPSSQKIIYHGLLSSIILFITVHIICLLVKCINSIVYYASTISIALIFMTISYYIANNKYVINNKLAILQLWLYCISCLLNLIDFDHINSTLNLVKIITNVACYSKIITILTQVFFIIIIYTARINKFSSS